MITREMLDVLFKKWGSLKSVSGHYDGCWENHVDCAVRLLIEELYKILDNNVNIPINLTPRDGEVLIRVRLDVLTKFLRKMNQEYHLPEYEEFLDAIDNSLHPHKTS